MQKGLKLKITSLVIRTLLFCLLAQGLSSARADLNEGHSFRPIAWEKDFTDQSSLALSAFTLSSRAQMVASEGTPVRSAFGLKLSQNLRDNWSGRMGLFCGRSSDAQDSFIWSFLGSDLMHPLIPESYFNHPAFRWARPHVYFGIGLTSRWANTGLKINLVPTMRYETTEPATYAGFEVLSQVAEEMQVGADYRFVQSARVSKNRGHMFGLSLVWGKLEKR